MFPTWNVALRAKLAVAWEEAALMQSKGKQDVSVRGHLNKRVAKILNLPNWLRLFVEEFFAVRYQMNLGKNPPQFRDRVSADSLLSYAVTLRDELDGFVSSRVRHRVRVCSSAKGASVSVTVVKSKTVIAPTIEKAGAYESDQLTTLLAAAEKKISQWFYVNRSVRLFDGDTIHLVKPSQQIEWTRTRALLGKH